MLVDELNRIGDDGGGDSGSPELEATVNHAENLIRALEEFFSPIILGELSTNNRGSEQNASSGTPDN